ncbi:hypothetical protein CDL12_06994 [Handroanthus impetiginosus]|uniref:Uncharacterized protein n=1 Tax=Handroanthus impetiginosus TaxID=429701 RepID=A0A2G9HS19_9LAMI|nr:hypothetical protein CDL12_06994 [Handroanthus impetiginosus]
MRPWLMMFLLLLSILVHEAQGIRLIRKGPPAERQNNINQELHPVKTNKDGVEEVILCKSKHCSGRIRKLTMTPISSTTTTAKTDKNEENKVQAKLEGSSRNEDILDIAGMDYSLARRKPPIHN